MRACLRRAGDADPEAAAEAFCKLTDSELQRLAGDHAVLLPLLQLEGPGWGMPALMSLQPLPDDWLRLTVAAYPGDTAAFDVALGDLGIIGSNHVYENVSLLERHPTTLDPDEDKLEPLVGATADLSHWATGFVARDHLPLLWRLAIADPPTWQAAVDNGPGFDALLTATPSPVPDDLAFDGLFEIFGDGSTRSLDQCKGFYERLGGARVLGDQERNPSLAWEFWPGITDGTETWDFRKQLIAVDANHDAWVTLLSTLRPMGRGTVMATRSLAFVHEYEWEWKQTGGSATSSAWHPFATPEKRPLGTSYAWDGIVTMFVDAGGGPETLQMGTDREGAGTGVGGGATTTSPLTYFENHAYHEFGHSVGAATFEGMSGSGSGDADGTTYGGWASESASSFTAAMFSRTTPGDVVHTPLGSSGPVTVTLDPSDVTDYLTTLVSTGTEPDSSNKLAAIPGLTSDDRLALLQASDDFKDEEMVKYVAAVRSNASAGDMPGNAFQFTGYTPSGGTTWIFASRFGNDFASYDTDAYNKVKDSTGWYALSSPVEMFAEIYTKHYADDTRPAARAGIDWDVFFQELEASPGAKALAGGAQAAPTGPTNAPAGSGEVEPPTNLIPG